MVDCRSIREEYRSLEATLWDLKAQETMMLADVLTHYKVALDHLDKMIELLRLYPGCFSESEDRVRIQNFRKSMLKYRVEREARGSMRQLDFLKEAAEWSTPIACLGGDCTLTANNCSHWISLSQRQRKMCVEKINAICSAFKLEAAFAAREFDYDETIEKRREAAITHRNVIQASAQCESEKKYNERCKNQQYLDYWQAVTECYVSLLEGDLYQSRKWLKRVLEIARQLPTKGCFPNYFHDINEIVAYQFYIDAIEKIKLAKFAEAGDLFQKWLDVCPSLEGYVRFDNIRIFKMICDILELVRQRKVTKSDWDELDDFVERATVARTTWVLLSRLYLIRELYYRAGQEWQTFDERNRLEEEINKEINTIAQKLWLFIPDSLLLGEDRTAGLRRGVNYISFLDIFDKLDENDPNWQQLLMQNLKHLLLVMADYEHLRYLYPPREEAQLPREEQTPVASEMMTIDQLVETILFYLKHRSKKHAYFFQRTLQHLEKFKSAIKNSHFYESIRAEKSIFDSIRFWPHVIRVEKHYPPRSAFIEENEPDSVAAKYECIRLWNKKPIRITFEGPQKLQEKSYYYLRPKWNTRFYRRFGPRLVRYEQFLQSDVPKLIEVFFRGVFENQKKTDPKRFRDWILQFGDHERLLACKFFDMVRFFGEEEMREMWIRLYMKKLPPEAKIEGVAYAGLGHTAKSGYYNFQYHLRQAISQLKDLKKNEVSFDFKKAFREISEYDRDNEKKPHTVVFVDDFIGHGKQAIDLFVNRDDAFFKKHQWLAQTKVYYCALVGFRKGILEIKNALSGKIEDVLVLETLEEKDRAFSKENPCWKSEQERGEAEHWASEIGRQVITGRAGYDPELDKLGWRGSQALIAFHYNVPNNTLPIFWGEGWRNGQKWNPLWRRYD